MTSTPAAPREPQFAGSQFAERHIGPTAADEAVMLAALGYESLDALIDAAVPAVIRRADGLDLPAALSETEAIAALRDLAGRNQVMTSLIGMGYSDTITPAVILRNVLENPAWYTAYTPYQPEISQGRLEALLNFQTMVTDLTAMDLANASLLDEATAAAEAMAMCRRLAPKGGDVFFVDADCHPQTIAVVQGRAEPIGIEVVVGDPERDLPEAGMFGALLQYPGSSGAVRDHAALVEHDPRAGGDGRGRHRSARAHACCGRRARSAPTSWSAPRSASASRSATAGRTPRSSRVATRTSARCRAGWSACPSTRRAVPRCGSRCRPGSSTSGARRPRATSAPRRCCSQSSPVSTRRTTAPTVCARSPTRVHRHTRDARGRAARWGSGGR